MALAAAVFTSLLSLVGAASAGPAPATRAASCQNAVSWKTAHRFVGHQMTVKGLVVGTKFARSSNGSPTFLNIGLDYPNPARFTVVIWGNDRSSFGAPERRYSGRTVCVSGRIEMYRGGFEIEVSSPRQIRIVG
jgi:DNA/RNA endonuclease YhcR with UshA esterase domain